MLTDRYGTGHSSDNAEALAAFEEAVHGVAAHRPSTGLALNRALAADPQLAAAHALKGFANVLLAREELLPEAEQAHRAAVAALQARGGGTPCEQALAEALGEAAQGRFYAAAARLERYLDGAPRTFLPAKVAHALRFMVGDAPGMMAVTARVLGAWSEAAPGYGFLLGCHAFALEELGDFAGAERVGLRAVELEPDDSWGLHAVSHVHEMMGRTSDGIAWLEDHRPVWSACNNFSFHMAWHLALFHLEREDHDKVLAIYDAEVRPTSTDDFRDVANAVSLLWRLEQEGVVVGRRWEELRAIAIKRRGDMTLTFSALHHLLTLLAVGDIGAAQELAGNMATRAACRNGDQATVVDIVGHDLASTLIALAAGGTSRARLDRLAVDLQRIGGSHAQRDVFLRTLAAFAAELGDRAAFDRIINLRRRNRRDDRFALVLARRLEAAESSPARRCA